MRGRRGMSGVPADVADENAASELFDQAERAFGGIDVVVNAAGAMSLVALVDFDLAVLNIASHDNVVLVERLDRFKMNGKTISVPVVGVFEFDVAGKFTAWRDYFDMKSVEDQIRG